MQIIKSSYEILEQEPEIKGIKKAIEKAGRLSYKSEDKITEDSCEEFVQRLINMEHGAVLEHGTVYLQAVQSDNTINLLHRYHENPYSKCLADLNNIYISTNYRVLVEHNWLDDLQYICEPTEYHEKRIGVKFILPISISREFLRHRKFSFIEMSTRYVNFSKDRFGGELTFIEPYWYNKYHPDGSFAEGFDAECKRAEELYMNLTKDCFLKPQEAREFLPLCTKTELIMTGFVSDWKHFFKLRADKHAHPQAQELAYSLQEEFKKKGLI